MKRLLLVFFSFILCSGFFVERVNAQNVKHTVSGRIKDAETNEELTGILVGVKEIPSKGVFSNEKGDYSLLLDAGDYTLVVSYLGYETQEIKVALTENLVRNISLKSGALNLNEVVVTAERLDDNVTNVQTGVERITVEEINMLPVLMGERDVIKAFQLLPGVKSAGEGGTGFFVRGGSADQNAVLLDNASLYNASHLMGFFSTFNSDAVKNATLYKGAMPAQYGERLASVLDVQMREGDTHKYLASGGVGLISSKFNIEGPIQKDKSSFLLSARRTYADVIARASGVSEASDATLYFYDINMKLNYSLSDKDRLYVSGFLGQDKLGFSKVMDASWGNMFGAVRWNRVVNNKMSMNTSFIYNRYAYDIDIDMDQDLQISSRINDYILKQDFQYFYSPASTWSFGYSTTYHDIAPGKYEYGEETGHTRPLQHRYSWENGVYLTNTLAVSDRLEIIYGARLSLFSVLGKGDFYVLDDNHKVVDTLSYKSGEFVKTYVNVEPRISTMYKLNDVSSVKAAYGRSSQNMHLLSSSAFTGPMDRWISSSNYIKPQVADQISLGYFRNFSDNMFEFSVEGYYKDMRNQIDFKDGADLNKNDDVETELLFGKGRAYGVEFLLRKRLGKLTGWIGYTLARSERKIDGINENKWYAATQDRTHDISIVGMYELNKKWSFSASWVYYTGNAVTYPSGKAIYDGQEYPYFEERNGYRAPAYHRLDLGAVCVLKDKKNFYSELAFGMYNAYGRENVYMLDFRENRDDPSKMTVYQYALFRFVPSISWNFKFR